MRKKIQILAVSVVAMLFMTACPGPEPKPDNNEFKPVDLPNNEMAEIYNRGNSLLGKSRAEVVAQLTEWGYVEDAEFGSDESEVLYFTEDEDERAYTNSQIDVTFGPQGKACCVMIESDEDTYERLSERMRLAAVADFVKTAGQTLTIATGETPAFGAYVDMMTTSVVRSDYATALSKVEQLGKAEDGGYIMHWGDGTLTGQEQAGEIQEAAQAGTLTTVMMMAMNAISEEIEGQQESLAEFLMLVASKQYGAGE